MDAFGRRVAKHRAALGWTQARLAERIAVSRVALSHLEAGMTVANERTVVLLAGTFGLEPHELVGGTDYPPAKAERLPVVAARHTEVAHVLAVLGVELAWADVILDSGRSGGAAELDPGLIGVARSRLGPWRQRLADLLDGCFDLDERTRIGAVQRALSCSLGALDRA